MLHRVDYLADLGITCLWLMPFYPTADRDDGYDITDFYGVDPKLGSAGDFVELVRTCHSRGIRIIVDFVMNHTSDRHPWWKEAVASTDSPLRDWYVWRSSTPPDTSKQVVFPDKEDAIWEKDQASGQWYLHNFYKTQPDLNLANPAVRDEVMRTMGYWLQVGVDGFRIDAVPFLFAEDQLPKRERKFPHFDPHAYLRNLKAFADRRNGTAMFLGEVNLAYPDMAEFFGSGDADELSMQFDFIAMQSTYLSLARGDARPLAKALRERPAWTSRASGPTSCATTTSSPSTSSARPSGRRSSTPSGRTPTCSCSTAGCGAGCHRCWVATSDGSGWPTR